MAKKIYIIGDENRLVVKNFMNNFKAVMDGWKFIAVPPSKDYIFFNHEDRNTHVFVCVSEDMDFELIKTIAGLQKMIGFFLYFVGASSSFGIAQNQFLAKTPSVRFSSYVINTNELVECVARNELAKKRILVVDDEPIILRSIKNWLGNDFDVSLVNSGETALEFLKMHPIDLVLLDYKMPGMEGPVVLKKIREDLNLSNTPVMFLTAQNDRESVLKVAPLKPQGYILKTKSPEEIKQAVEDFFANRVVTI